MSINRHEPCVRTLALAVPPGYRIAPHGHDWPQLVYALQGAISVSSGASTWVVPPMRALWIDAGVEHALHMRGRVEMRTLYFRPDMAPRLGLPCCVIEVAPLLRELIVAIVANSPLNESRPGDMARHQLLVELLLVKHEEPLVLPIPRDPRAQSVAKLVIERIGSSESLTQLARGTGASARTLERLFLAETGMTFGRWRQHARFHEAIRLLAEGLSVGTVAVRVGYSSPSAFIAAFRANFGKTPAEYFQPRG